MTHVRHVLAFTLLATAGAAFSAEGAGAYLLAGGGTSHLSVDCAGTTSCDNNGSSFKLIGGWRLGNGIALEAISLDFGKARATVPIGSLRVAAELKSKGFGLGVALGGKFAPHWSATARLGALSMKGTTSVSASGLSGSEGLTSTQAYAGLSLAYHFSPAVSAELGIDSARSKFAGDQTATVRALTLGLGLSF